MDKFTKVRNIGKGNMGACALARNNEDGQYYVIKQVDLTRMNKKERQQSLNEARVLSSLRHPNVINYVDSFLAKKSDHLCIVMEFADGGDVSSRIKNNFGVNFRESEVLDWFIQLVLSLHYVHQRKILHRDVKTQNVFLTSDSVVKLGDFGIARTLSGTYDQAKTFVGTPYYLSPELILERPYDHRSDVWALGVVLYELLTLKHPFNASDMKGLMQRILKVQYDPISMIYSAEARGLVSRLLVKDPAQRIELADVLRLPVVQRRMTEWLRGDVVPQKYLDSLIRHRLLPSELLDRAKDMQQHDQATRSTDTGRGSESSRTSGGGATATTADSDSDNGECCRSDATEPHLPPLSARRSTPSAPLPEQSHTAPLTADAGHPSHRVRFDRLASPKLSSTPPPLQPPLLDPAPRAAKQHPSAASGGRPLRVVPQRFQRNGAGGGGMGMGIGAAQAPTSLGARPLRGLQHAPGAMSAARANPLPPRLSSLDNFYQQLNYYHQQRGGQLPGGGVGAVGGVVGSSSSSNSAAHINNHYSIYSSRAAGAGVAPSYTPYSGAGAAPPAHIPVTVVSSRRVTRKRSGVPAASKAVFRPSANYSLAGVGGGGGGGAMSSPPTEAAVAPDIKAMLQRAAQERAQRRLGAGM